MIRRTRIGVVAGTFAIAVLALPASASERIVALGASITEIVYALGAVDRLIAVDSTSRFPPEVERLPNVGYFRSISAEGILSLRPSLVVGVEGAGPAQAIERLRASGTSVRLIADDYSVDGVEAKVRAVAAALDLHEQGEMIARAIRSDAALARDRIAALRGKPKVLFVLSAARGSLLASGADTAAAAMIALAGGRNAVSGYRGYKPLAAEAAAGFNPDIIVMMDQTVEQAGGLAAVLALPALATTAAARNGRLVSIDGPYLLGFGPRLAHAVHDLAAAIHSSEYPTASMPDRPWVGRREAGGTRQ